MFKCSRCSKEFESYTSLGKHSGRVHNVKGELLNREYFHNDVIPKCQCGCGQEVNWHSSRYLKYCLGHSSRGELNPMFGSHHSKEAKENISKKRKEKFANGEYRIWQNEKTPETLERIKLINEKSRKENNPERARKISEYFKGKPKSEEHKRKSKIGIIKAWENPELRDKQRVNRFEYFKDTVKKHNTGIELKMIRFLNTLKIEYEHPFFLGGKIYDFKLTNYSVIIETDGDFYHCNPINHPLPIYEIQKKSVENDKLKNELAKSAGYTLLRFWESDINENPQKVIQTLLDAIK